MIFRKSTSKKKTKSGPYKIWQHSWKEFQSQGTTRQKTLCLVPTNHMLEGKHGVGPSQMTKEVVQLFVLTQITLQHWSFLYCPASLEGRADVEYKSMLNLWLLPMNLALILLQGEVRCQWHGRWDYTTGCTHPTQ